MLDSWEEDITKSGKKNTKCPKIRTCAFLFLVACEPTRIIEFMRIYPKEKSLLNYSHVAHGRRFFFSWEFIVVLSQCFPLDINKYTRSVPTRLHVQAYILLCDPQSSRTV